MNIHVRALKSLIQVILIAITLAFPHVVEASALLSDDFNATTLEANPAWRFYDPYDTTAGNDAGESSLTFDSTNALISIPDGLGHDLWTPTNKNKAPRLLQTAPDTDFKFEVKFETVPNVRHQLQGIIVQENDNVFLRFDIFYNISDLQLFVAFIDATTNTTTTYASITLPNSPSYRQVIRSGDDWTFRYSDDGTIWTDAVTFTKNLAVTEVGFFAGTAGRINPAFLSSVDYFIDLDEPITDSDIWTPPPPVNAAPPVINTWNGFSQSAGQFGQPGITQKWANILGNVSTDIYLSTLSYTINNGSEQSLAFGPDTRRLDNRWDFNIEIDHATLNAGTNTVNIKAKDSNDQETIKDITISYDPGNSWPLPYTADWGSLATIKDVEDISHIVDGLWDLTVDGIRTVETGYDRTIAIGDETWQSDNYEVTVPFTLHSGFSGIGFAVGWQGHEGTQVPRIEWPLQALAWIRGSINNPTLNIVTYGGLIDWEVTEVSQQLAALTTNEKYMLKSYSEPLSAGLSRFHVKFWKQSDGEPTSWNINADVPTRDGSVLLVAHKGDVTFGNVSVGQSSSPPDTVPPVISNTKVSEVTASSATITWNTNETANSKIEYGLDNNYGINVNDSTQTKNHSLTLTGLNPNTGYHYQVKSTDSSNNTANSSDMVFVTTSSGDTTPPVINNIQVTVTNTSATITWDTNEPSTSEVNYGLDSNYGLKVNDSTMTTTHMLILTGLSPNTDYYYQVKSTDMSNNTASSDSICLSGISGGCKLKTSAIISEEAKECLFNWAEQQYPDVFSPALPPSQLFEDYTYRYYSDTNIYLGFFQNKKVHYLEASKSDGIIDAGNVENYQVLAGCL